MSICFAKMCDREIPGHHLMCLEHWRQVAPALQQAVISHYRSRNRSAWARAAMAARRSIAE